jgi:uncharacterized protein involved in response to NO
MTIADRWTIFAAAPHRVMMFGGTIQLVAALTFWSLELLGRYTSAWPPLETTVPTTFAHGFLMLYMVFSFFFFGFLMTTYPRWMNGRPISRPRYVSAFLLMASGAALFYIGLFASQTLVEFAISVFMVGYGVGLLALWGVYRVASSSNKIHETFLNVALMLGWLGMLAFLLWLITGQSLLLEVSRDMGLWWFVMPVLLIVATRMIPFFTSCVPGTGAVGQPRFGMQIMLGLAAVHGALETSGLPQWTWLVDIPLAVVAFFHTIRWGFFRSFRDRLLAVLHVGFSWFWIGMLLYSARSILLLVHAPDYLGRAPLHALGIGFVVSMTVAMVTRVTLGHSGRSLTADRFVWTIFWGVGATAVLRILAELPTTGMLHGISFNVLAVIGLLTLILAWVLRLAPIYLRARIDGKPG